MLSLIYNFVTWWYPSYREGKINVSFFPLFSTFKDNELLLYHTLQVTTYFKKYYELTY